MDNGERRIASGARRRGTGRTVKRRQRLARRTGEQGALLRLLGAGEQRLKQLPHNPERKLAFKLPAPPGQNPHPGQHRTLPGHPQQDALADPRRTGDQEQVPAVRLGQGKQGVDLAQFTLTLEQASPHQIPHKPHNVSISAYEAAAHNWASILASAGQLMPPCLSPAAEDSTALSGMRSPRRPPAPADGTGPDGGAE